MAQTTVPLNTPSEQPTRRTLLGTMAAAGIVGAAPAMAAGAADPHLAWERQASALQARVSTKPMSDAESDVIMDEVYEFEDLIGKTPTRTVAGAMVQLRLVRNYLDLAMGISNSGCDLAAMANAFATLERFGIGRGRA